MSIQDDPPAIGDAIPITEVELQTGIRQATLRMWEKRYGFPQPLRDRHGDRVYPPGQVERLHAVRRLIDQGLRPGKIFSSAAACEPVDPGVQPDAHAGIPEHYRPVFDLLRDYRLSDLHALFQHRMLDLGLRRFVIEFLAPLTIEIGLAWRRGELPTRYGHLFAQLATAGLHAKQAAVRAAGDSRPRVVMATLTGEAHVLGILMAEAVMTSMGMHCIQLGADTPPPEVAAAAIESDADIVALSFSVNVPCRNMVRMVAAMRTALPPSTALWVGGEGMRAAGTLLPGIETFDSLDAIEPALRRWRLAHPSVEVARRSRS
ncbi:cobalamin-dependent protein [Massilia sp. UMI-21]|nr:cobalamin-dependent protein [Massilia sp. UMI-21]